jgi:predicted Zn-dependent peptidase
MSIFKITIKILLIGVILMTTSEAYKTMNLKNKNSLLPKYYEKTLSNGLKVVVIPYENKSSVVNVKIFYKVGSKDEVMGKSGIAHMLEHLNFKSTKNLKAGEFDEIVTSFGGSNNAATSFDYTNYYIKSSKSNLDKSLYLFSELMANLNLKDSEFQTEREVVAQEQLLRTANDPSGFLFFKLFNNLYEYSSYHWTPIGFSDDIKNWKLSDIKKFHQKYYNPNNAILVVSGDISTKEVYSLAKKHFGKIKNRYKKLPNPNHMKEPIFNGEKNIVYYKNVSTQTIITAYKIPHTSSKKQVALDAIGDILSSGKSSILYKTLIEDKQLVTSFYAYNMDLNNESVFLLFANCNNGVDAKLVQKEFFNAINSLKTTLVDDSVLSKIQKNTKKDFILSLQSASSLSSIFGSYLVKDDINSLLEYEKNTNSLKAKYIQQVANEFLNYPTTVVLKNESETKTKK